MDEGWTKDEVFTSAALVAEAVEGGTKPPQLAKE